MREERTPSPWIPLGSAQIVDWKHLGRPVSARGATAWTARIGHEPVLLRSWSNESTTFYEFYFLAHDGLSGTMVVSTSRPEPTRLRLKATVDVEGRLGYSDMVEFQEHPLTGLHGSTVRTVEVSAGDLRADRVANLTAAEAEILEYAPESALLTSCGWWIHSVLDAVRSQLLDGEEVMEHSATASANHEHRAPTPIPVKPSVPVVEEEPEEKPKPVSTRGRETYEGPPEPKKRPEPEPSVRPKKKKQTLIASTNTGDQWEITDAETYIGRSKQCAIVLKSQRVSRKHATVTIEEDGFYINDLGAANGIWAGTEKIDREKIEDGAEYIIGDVLVTFTIQQ